MELFRQEFDHKSQSEDVEASLNFEKIIESYQTEKLETESRESKSASEVAQHTEKVVSNTTEEKQSISDGVSPKNPSKLVNNILSSLKKNRNFVFKPNRAQEEFTYQQRLENLEKDMETVFDKNTQML